MNKTSKKNKEMNDNRVKKSDSVMEKYDWETIKKKYGKPHYPEKPINLIEKDLHNTLTKGEASRYRQLKRNRCVFLKAQIEWEKKLKNGLKRPLNQQHIECINYIIANIIKYMEWDEVAYRMMTGKNLYYGMSKFYKQTEEELRKKFHVSESILLIY